ncbi:MAG: hypothetical protein ACTIJ9_14010 [Aequorivita sp.]
MKYLTLIILLIITIQNTSGQNLNERQIVEITQSIPELILKNYVFKDKGKTISAEFRKLVNSKKYLKFTDPDNLSKILSNDLKEISNDGHMYVKVKKNKYK